MNEDGHTSSIKDKILTLIVRPGWLEGTRITFAKEGDQGPNTIPGKFIIKHISQVNFLIKKNTDLFKILDINLTGLRIE